MRQTIAAGLVVCLAACSGNSATQPTPAPSTLLKTSSGLLRSSSVTFTADSACSSLPQSVQSRTYSGGAGDGGPYTLAGANFASWLDYGPMNVISLAVFGDTAEAWFSDGPIVELVTPESTLMITGHAEGPIAGSAIELRVTGTFLFCPKTNADGMGCSVPQIECRSTKHKLVLNFQ